MYTAERSVIIQRPLDDVFAAVSDITRMGEWSPECTGGEWVAGAEPGLGAEFLGHNKAAGKRWTTTSEVTGYEPGAVFEFTAEGHTVWRYEFESVDGGTRLTESYVYPPFGGARGFLYDTILRRPAAMAKGMQRTLDRIKERLEAS